MKVPLSLRRLYEDQEEINEPLRVHVDLVMGSLKEPRWHYESRIKTQESYALKVEAGRISDPSRLEDFFACTWVVPTVGGIQEAEKKVRDNFKLIERRPPQDGNTAKCADSFPFDDLRLYVSVEDNPALPPYRFSGVVFEVQIKTFLQHAWSYAVHDLTYKSDEASWSKQRIAYQVKAMLEHAELSIQEAETLAQSPALKKTDQRTRNLQDMIQVLNNHWDKDQLPANVRRLAENTCNITEALKIKANHLSKILNEEKGMAAGALSVNLSPYGVIVQALLRQKKEEMRTLLSNNDKRATKVLIPSEIDFPDDIDQSTCCNAVFVKQTRL